MWFRKEKTCANKDDVRVITVGLCVVVLAGMFHKPFETFLGVINPSSTYIQVASPIKPTEEESTISEGGYAVTQTHSPYFPSTPSLPREPRIPFIICIRPDPSEYGSGDYGIYPRYCTTNVY